MQHSISYQTVLLPASYAGPVDYYRLLAKARRAIVEQHEHYVKQSLRNRCWIYGANGPQALTVPVEKLARPDSPLRDVRISEHGRWRHLHWAALVSAYRNSPFFDYYEADFAPFYEQRYTFLIDFDEAICRTACRLLDIDVIIERTTVYMPVCPPSVADCRKIFEEKPSAKPYYQVFADRHGFVPNLSVFDLLFNLGPEGLLYLLS
jgi:hypothetical protein